MYQFILLIIHCIYSIPEMFTYLDIPSNVDGGVTRRLFVLALISTFVYLL